MKEEKKAIMHSQGAIRGYEDVKSAPIEALMRMNPDEKDETEIFRRVLRQVAIHTGREQYDESIKIVNALYALPDITPRPLCAPALIPIPTFAVGSHN